MSDRLPSGLPRVRRRQRYRTALFASIAAVIVAAALAAFVVRLASQRPDQVHLGASTFQLGSASRLAATIRQQRAPFLFKDPLTSGAGRELYVQHLGTDAKTGWVAVEAYAPGAPRAVRCILRWDGEHNGFVDPCGHGTYPADGTGLRAYPVVVNARGVVEVDLKS